MTGCVHQPRGSTDADSFRTIRLSSIAWVCSVLLHHHMHSLRCKFGTELSRKSVKSSTCTDTQRAGHLQDIRAGHPLWIFLKDTVEVNGRSGRIRTHDPFTPSDVPEENGPNSAGQRSGCKPQERQPIIRTWDKLGQAMRSFR